MPRRDWLWPWQKHHFEGKPSHLKEICDLMEMQGFDVNVKFPSHEHVGIAREVLNCLRPRVSKAGKVFADKKEDRPWVIMCSNSDTFLAEMENIIPITFALTYRMRVIGFDNNNLAYGFRTNGKRFYGEDNEDISYLNSAFFLSYRRPENSPHGYGGITNNSSKVCAILDNHFKLRLPMLITYLLDYNVKEVTSYAKTYHIFSSNLGEKVAQRLLEHSVLSPHLFKVAKVLPLMRKVTA